MAQDAAAFMKGGPRWDSLPPTSIVLSARRCGSSTAVRSAGRSLVTSECRFEHEPKTAFNMEQKFVIPLTTKLLLNVNYLYQAMEFFSTLGFQTWEVERHASDLEFFLNLECMFLVFPLL